MGTRNLTCVYIDGKYKVAQYGQWDGYPSGQGKTVLNFLHKYYGTDQWDVFLKKVRAVNNDPDQIEKVSTEVYKSIGVNEISGFVTMAQANQFKQKLPQLDRDMGAKILEYIYKSEDGLFVQNEINFAADSLFCEWCYVIDIDKDTFEVYKGFNKSKLKSHERFAFLSDKSEGEYNPVVCFMPYELKKLPTVEEFLKIDREDEGE